MRTYSGEKTNSQVSFPEVSQSALPILGEKLQENALQVRLVGDIGEVHDWDAPQPGRLRNGCLLEAVGNLADGTVLWQSRARLRILSSHPGVETIASHDCAMQGLAIFDDR